MFKKIATEQNPLSEEKFYLEFNAEQRRDKVGVLDRKIRNNKKREELGIADKRDKWRLTQFIDRRSHVDSVWLFTNYIVVKCGSELKYISKEKTGIFEEESKPKNFNINFGSEVWIQDIYSTGIDDLV